MANTQSFGQVPSDQFPHGHRS